MLNVFHRKRGKRTGFRERAELGSTSPIRKRQGRRLAFFVGAFFVGAFFVGAFFVGAVLVGAFLAGTAIHTGNPGSASRHAKRDNLR